MTILRNRKNRIRILAGTLALVFALGGFTGCREAEAETVPEGVIRIGVLEPLTGQDSLSAKAELRGIELAHELCAVVGDYTVELIEMDNESELKKSVKAAETLVRKGCIAALGSYGNMLTLAASDTLEEASIPLVNVTGTNPLLTGSSPYLFRTATVETDQAEQAAVYLSETLGITDIAILMPDGNDYAETMAEGFDEVLGTETEKVLYLAGETDFSTQIKVLRSTGCRGVYLLGNAEDTAVFLTQAKLAGRKWTYFGTQNLKTEEFLELAGLAAEGIYTTGDWDPLIAYTERSTRFLTSYRSRYGEDTVPTEAEALGYEAYMLIIDAIGRALSADEDGVLTGEDVRNALVETSGFEGVTGIAHMDEEGDLSREQAVWMVAEGTFVNPKTYVPKSEILLDPALTEEDDSEEGVFNKTGGEGTSDEDR